MNEHLTDFDDDRETEILVASPPVVSPPSPGGPRGAPPKPLWPLERGRRSPPPRPASSGVALEPEILEVTDLEEEEALLELLEASEPRAMRARSTTPTMPEEVARTRAKALGAPSSGAERTPPRPAPGAKRTARTQAPPQGGAPPRTPRSKPEARAAHAGPSAPNVDRAALAAKVRGERELFGVSTVSRAPVAGPPQRPQTPTPLLLSLSAAQAAATPLPSFSAARLRAGELSNGTVLLHGSGRLSERTRARSVTLEVLDEWSLGTKLALAGALVIAGLSLGVLGMRIAELAAGPARPIVVAPGPSAGASAQQP